MIIFGTKTKLLSNSPENFLGDCDYCHTPKSVFAHKEVSYFHIFWIPIFPYRSKIITICGHCKRVNSQSDINPQTLNEIRAKGMPKIPKRYFFGIILIGLLFLAIIIVGIFSLSKTNAYLDDPKIGDIYKIEMNEGGRSIYTLYRVADVTADSITFLMNDYEATDRKSFRELQEQHADNYSEKIVLSRDEVLELYEENQISTIKRD